MAVWISASYLTPLSHSFYVFKDWDEKFLHTVLIYKVDYKIACNILMIWPRTEDIHRT